MTGELFRGGGSSRRRASLLAAIVLVGTFLWMDRSSLERGNSLYRDGRKERAAQLYRARAESRFAAPEALYNLGTVLMSPPGDPDAERYLSLATETGDSAATQRGHYNLGVQFLIQLELSSEPDSWAPLLAAAIGSNRAALRLDPGDRNARWNLAFSQLLFNELTGVREFDDGAPAEEEESRSGADEGLVIPEPGQDDNRPPPTEGNREALAGEDPGALTEAEAIGLVETVDDDPEQLLWGIFWSHRPDVNWWEEGYPGGSW